ncbi:amidohydrolase/deacetylase family metallohydrolase [Cohnella sp. 56]|uniref:amidohydrolase/deacetylase family metallohydrolase n=1 Tax=Cohnella sp. 56 TaxID=3113722 RepID=UPI0030EADAD3
MLEKLVLRQARLLDGRIADIEVEDGVIAGVAVAGDTGHQGPDSPDAAEPGVRVVDCAGAYVSGGWIDMHVHAFPEFDPYGDEIDEIGVKQGVATIVDAGSCGADRIDDLAASGERAKTNLLAFLNISRIGLQRVDELSQLAWIDGELACEAVRRHPELIVGLKARISRSVVGDSGIAPLRIARELSAATGLPLMVHIGSAPPAIEDVLSCLERRDIVTHYLNGKPNNLFDEAGHPLPALLDALARGVRLDVGHGTASFSFRVAEAAKRHGIGLHTISSDIYRGNRMHGPVYSLANVMTKFLYLGYSLQEVVAAVTSGAAAWLGRPELGRILDGDPASLTVFEVREEPVSLIDSDGDRRQATQRIVPRGVVANGEYIECEVRA